MATFLLRRLAWLVPTLLGLSLVTFALLELAPGDRALLATHDTEPTTSAETRAATLRALRAHFGQVDPTTGEPVPFAQRYWRWVTHAARLDFAGASEDPAAFRARIAAALPVTLLLAVLTILATLAVAVPLGTRLGLRNRSAGARAVSSAMLALWALPEFLLGTLLILLLAGGIGPELLPAAGLRSQGAEAWSPLARALDFASHLVLPVFTLALGPTVWLTRQLRESVARTDRSDFARYLRGLGLDEALVRRRVVRNGLAPLATAIAALLPLLVSGSVVVERLFALPGLGDLACRAALARETPMIMALTTLTGAVTLLGLAASDIAHRLLDPRIDLRGAQ